MLYKITINQPEGCRRVKMRNKIEAISKANTALEDLEDAIFFFLDGIEEQIKKNPQEKERLYYHGIVELQSIKAALSSIIEDIEGSVNELYTMLYGK
jgi:GTP1/Obg family GTP-binding protein